MKIYLPAATAAALAAPASGYGLSGYSHFPRTTGLIVRPSSVCTPAAMIRQQQALMNRAFRTSSPRYEITDNNEKFEISVDLPGVKASDINVSIENDGQCLTLSGHRELNKGGYEFSSRFSQSFTLDRAVDADKFTAKLKNGVLVVSAPKDWKKIEDAVKTIPITEFTEEDIPVARGDQQATLEAEQVDAEMKEEEEIKVETVTEEAVEVEKEEEPQKDENAETPKDE